MQVLVTGGAGFIGGNLCRRLVATPGVDRVVVIDDLSTGNADNLTGVDVELVQASINDHDALERAVLDADAIVHLAALGSVPRSVLDPIASHVANTTGTLHVLEAARRHGGLHTIVASSSSVYGANPLLPKHEQLATRPMSPYAATKLATESYTLAWGHSYGMPVLAFRFFNVFGPLQPAGHAYAAVVPAFVAAALAGEPLVVHGDGTQTRDFTFVDTVTAVITDALLRRVTDGEPMNLAYGGRTSLLEVIDMIEQLVGHPVERHHVPVRVGDVPHSQADSSRLVEHFGHIEPTPLADGLRATVDWMRGR